MSTLKFVSKLCQLRIRQELKWSGDNYLVPKNLLALHMYHKCIPNKKAFMLIIMNAGELLKNHRGCQYQSGSTSDSNVTKQLSEIITIDLLKLIHF